MNARKEIRDAARPDAERRQAEKAQDLADDCEDLERFADDGGSWINVEQSEDAYFRKNQTAKA
jgi:hypothetical protein